MCIIKNIIGIDLSRQTNTRILQQIDFVGKLEEDDDSYISHNEIVSVNNVLREYNEMKKEIFLELSMKYSDILNNHLKKL